ncbi:MAG: hypothetical protein QM496_14530 [Verrucomicrobiota bacterium]
MLNLIVYSQRDDLVKLILPKSFTTHASEYQLHRASKEVFKKQCEEVQQHWQEVQEKDEFLCAASF